MAIGSRTGRLGIALLTAAVIATSSAGPAQGQSPPRGRDGTGDAPPTSLDLSGGTDGLRFPPGVLRAADRNSRMDSAVATIAATAAGEGSRAALRTAAEHRSATADGRVRVVVEAATGQMAGAEQAVLAVGGHVEATYHDLVQAAVDASTLAALAADNRIAYVRLPHIPTIEAVTSQGVASSTAPAWHGLGYIGSGVKVGVIDLAFAGYAARQASGELPQNLVVKDFCNGNVNAAGGEHGTQVAQIIADMAPGVQLYLLCIGTEVQMGQAKDYAKQQGIHIISSSLGTRRTSRGDGTGGPTTPEGIAKDARDNGILWIQSAGNYASGDHWHGQMADADNDQFLEFAPGVEINAFNVPAGVRFCAELRWDAWPTTNQDFDLYIWRFADTSVVATSLNTQTGSQSPVEVACYTNTGTSQFFGVIVNRFSASINPRFDVFVVGFGLNQSTASSSLNDVASSPHSFAVGAVCWQNNAYESYSSQGPTVDGRVKPDIAGYSSVSTVEHTSSGCGTGAVGTSFSQPGVAGAAVLAKSANPSFTPAQLQSFLETRALDLGAAGKDTFFGWGRLLMGATPPPINVSATTRGGTVNGGGIANPPPHR
ncbi:MAG: S8 family serine peptidase [Chloroflexota bacterium]